MKRKTSWSVPPPLFPTPSPGGFMVPALQYNKLLSHFSWFELKRWKSGDVSNFSLQRSGPVQGGGFESTQCFSVENVELYLLFATRCHSFSHWTETSRHVFFVPWVVSGATGLISVGSVQVPASFLPLRQQRSFLHLSEEDVVDGGANAASTQTSPWSERRNTAWKERNQQIRWFSFERTA